MFKTIETPLSVAIVVMLSAFLSGCGFFSEADEKFYFGEGRRPDKLEYEYRALANELGSIKPCYLIHSQSLTKNPFNSSGTRVSLLRSSCFAAVARKSNKEWMCEKVRSASTLFLSGAILDADSCRSLARVKGGASFSLDVPKMIYLAGYDENEVDEYLVSEGRFSSVRTAASYRRDRPDTYWNEVRMTLLHTERYFGRIAQFPGFGTPEDRKRMDALKWEPRQMRLWTVPEERMRSAPEVRVPAKSGQE